MTEDVQGRPLDLGVLGDLPEDLIGGRGREPTAAAVEQQWRETFSLAALCWLRSYVSADPTSRGITLTVDSLISTMCPHRLSRAS